MPDVWQQLKASGISLRAPFTEKPTRFGHFTYVYQGERRDERFPYHLFDVALVRFVDGTERRFTFAYRASGSEAEEITTCNHMSGHQYTGRRLLIWQVFWHLRGRAELCWQRPPLATWTRRAQFLDVRDPDWLAARYAADLEIYDGLLAFLGEELVWSWINTGDIPDPQEGR
jgi:hypothetical protein